MSRQSEPSGKTLGWKISEVNRTRGGRSGYVSGNVMRREKAPPGQEQRQWQWHYHYHHQDSHWMCCVVLCCVVVVLLLVVLCYVVYPPTVSPLVQWSLQSSRTSHHQKGRTTLPAQTITRSNHKKQSKAITK